MIKNVQSDFIPKAALARELGISGRTISRWLGDEGLCFPRPIRLRGRLYFHRHAIEKWKMEKLRALAVVA